MTTTFALRRASLQSGFLAALVATGVCASALAQTPTQTQPEPPPARTLELQFSQGQLTANLPDARAANVRGTWVFADGQVAGFEALDETKFGARGGVLAGSYSRTFGPDWYATVTGAIGHGGPNWARQRVDIDIATKWGAERSIVTHLAVNAARYDNDRSDSGLRATVVAYLAGPTVVEGGVLFNVSSPGSVNSHMPFASVTWGREGWQYLSLRVSSGTEAYQALGASQQLVNFHSSSVALSWRRWVDRRWGVIVTAESYRNPSYQRRTAGAGLLVHF